MSEATWEPKLARWSVSPGKTAGWDIDIGRAAIQTRR
jgi:hypothetical protein